MTNHLENHPHAFIDNNNKVIQVAAFDESGHDSELLDAIKIQHNAVQVVCCCEFGMAEYGMYWREDKKQFTPIKGYVSWSWNEEAWTWIPPVPEPIIDETRQVNFWNETTMQWDTISTDIPN